jgi:hypothetical protein
MMSTREEPDEAEIRQLIDKLVEGIRTMDLDGLKESFPGGALTLPANALNCIRVTASLILTTPRKVTSTT